MRPGAVGDFILTLPAARVLARSFPDAGIEFVGTAAAKPLLPMVRELAACTDFGSPWLSSLFAGAGELGAEAAQYVSRFDTAVCYFRDDEQIVGPRLRKAGVARVVFCTASPSRGMHVAQHLINGLRELGIRGKAEPPAIHADARSRSLAAEFLRSMGVSSDRPLVALHPGAGSPQKRWPMSNFGELARVLKEHGFRILVTWGPAEPDVKDSLGQPSWAGVVGMANLPLDVLAAVMERCILFVGNDSGITHLAAALGVPSIALFGPTDSEVWKPLGKSVKVVQGRCEFSPCPRERRRSCPFPECMASISLETVRRMALALISQRS